MVAEEIRDQRGEGGVAHLAGNGLEEAVELVEVTVGDGQEGGRVRVLGARKWHILVKIGIPRSMPYFFASLKVAITLAFVGSVVAETVAANKGIGWLMMAASGR